MTHFRTALFSITVALASLFLSSQATYAEEPNTNFDLDQSALKLAWTFETGKPFNIAPTAGGGMVFAIPVNGPLTAFDAKTGHVNWTYAPKEGLWDRGLSVDGEQLFVCYKGGKFAAMDIRTGTVQWKTDIGIDCQRPHHISGDTVYVSTTLVGQGLQNDGPYTGATLFAIDRNSGHIKWELKTVDFLLQTTTSRDGTLFLAGNYINKSYTDTEGGPAHYYGIDQYTGDVKWTYANFDGTPKVVVATEKNLLFVAYQDFVQALDKETGKLLWRRDSDNWTPGIVADDKDLFFGSATTIVHSWDIVTGKKNWKFNIPGKRFDYLLIKPQLVDDRLYFMSQRGFVYALDKSTGKQLFRYSTGMNARVGITYKDGFLYMNDSKGRVYGFKIIK